MVSPLLCISLTRVLLKTSAMKLNILCCLLGLAFVEQSQAFVPSSRRSVVVGSTFSASSPTTTNAELFQSFVFPPPPPPADDGRQRASKWGGLLNNDPAEDPGAAGGESNSMLSGAFVRLSFLAAVTDTFKFIHGMLYVVI
jgi:hypothetical protein